MPMEPDVPAHVYSTLKGCLQNSDKQGAIDLYYELLSSGHSVGEILSAVGRIQSKSEHGDTATAEYPQSASGEMATEVTSGVVLKAAAQADAPCAPGPGVPRQAESCGIEEPRAIKSASLNELGSDDWEQFRDENLPGSDPDIVGSAGAHTATGRAVALRSSDQGQFLPRKSPGIAKRIAFGTLYTAAVASASIAGFSIVRADRDAEPTPPRIQSDISSGTKAGAIPGSEAVAEAPIPKKQVVNAASLHAPKPPRPDEPDLAVPDPPQRVAAGVQMTVSTAGPERQAPHESETGPLDATGQSNRAAAAPPGPVPEPIPLAAASSLAVRTGATGTASPSDTGQPDAGGPHDAAGTARSASTVLSEAPSTAATQAAKARDGSEPARTNANDPAKAATPAPAMAKTVAPVPETPDAASAAAAQTGHRLAEAGRGVTGAANPGEAARANQPDVVLPLAREAAAAPMPRATETTPEERRLTNAEADALVIRGDAFFATGDLASARLFYEYAAAAGNGAAALRLGGTFDPAFLARARVGRVQGDLPSALYWYRRARDLGNGDAEILLRGMENTAR